MYSRNPGRWGLFFSGLSHGFGLSGSVRTRKVGNFGTNNKIRPVILCITVCGYLVSVTKNAAFLVPAIIIKLTRMTRGGIGGGTKEGGIRSRGIGEIGLKRSSLPMKPLDFTVPIAAA
jgi:hypothetical protein